MTLSVNLGRTDRIHEWIRGQSRFCPGFEECGRPISKRFQAFVPDTADKSLLRNEFGGQISGVAGVV
jgi:hypothetical protein